MRPSMVMLSIMQENFLGEFKFSSCSISSQFLSNPPPMMPIKANKKHSCELFVIKIPGDA